MAERMIYSMLSEDLFLCVSPFNILNGNGYMQFLYEHLPKMIKLISVGNKPKIVKAMLYLLGQLIHMIENIPDLMKQIAENCCSAERSLHRAP